ncbi:acid sphingomyelinase-like phosphodiesterase 3a [Pseudoliparis swirei]|uniref:acid sphingomyelinase-like phosphodiesterase 3a n=1 Tax=Pseudoliparis swirei TaxID=2059687 RepID=UPI0024BE2F7A|nr:acid sphingomyelinase-like phosphodiesterase 3a [Pseudoliparis swirei]
MNNNAINMARLVCVALLLLSGATPHAASPAGRGSPPGAGRFWHITDLHLDPSYQPGPDPTKVCSSSRGEAAAHAGLFGDFLCDAPYALIQSAFAHMAPLTRPQDFIIWTGDSPPHVPADQLSTDSVIRLISNMTRTIRDHFPNLTVYPALGNHDYWPQDQMPASANAVYAAVARLWRPWLRPAALLTLSRGGFYSQLARPGLRVLSLNTVLYYGPDHATHNQTDPAGQFQWLEETLEEAARSLEKVYIIAHVPVGYLPFARSVPALRERHNERLVSIFRRHSDVIAGHFYGHTHRDSFMVLLDRGGKPLSSLFVAPAVTPIKQVLEPYSNNPAVRAYLYDAEDYGLLDIWQYFLNLTEANESRRAAWRLEYTMTEAFGLADLRPAGLLRLARSFAAPGAESFAVYFRHYAVAYDGAAACEGDCKLSQVCAALHLDGPAYSQCVVGGWRRGGRF